jgi:hypothetical protein
MGETWPRVVIGIAAGCALLSLVLLLTAPRWVHPVVPTAWVVTHPESRSAPLEGYSQPGSLLVQGHLLNRESGPRDQP